MGWAASRGSPLDDVAAPQEKMWTKESRLNESGGQVYEVLRKGSQREERCGRNRSPGGRVRNT